VPVRPDRRARRHEATRQEILDAAWRLARERGLGGWSLRDVAEAVGMRAPSLYGYFAGKNAVFDAMFVQGYEQVRQRFDEPEGGDPVEQLRRAATAFVDFCVEDPARYQLLFLRTLPGFEPSPEAYAVAVDVLERSAAMLAAAGVGSPEQVDLWTALLTGLASQQVSNDPGGDRWRRLAPAAVDMFLREHLPPADAAPVRRRRGPVPRVRG
jgi:AcrR family transcriptional regulator